jgi:hypothetical protein
MCTEVFADNAYGGCLLVVDPTAGTVGRRVPLGMIAPEAVAASPDHRRLAFAQLNQSGAGLVLILDARTLQPGPLVAVPPGPRATDVSFSPDGRLVAVTGQNRDLYVIDPATRTSWRDIVPVGAALLQAEWLADNRTVALGSSDGKLSLFDTERRQLRTPPVPVANDGAAAHVHVVPGISDELLALSGERPGRSWPVDPEVWVEQACALAGRDLSRQEWAQFLPDRPYRSTC